MWGKTAPIFNNFPLALFLADKKHQGKKNVSFPSRVEARA